LDAQDIGTSRWQLANECYRNFPRLRMGRNVGSWLITDIDESTGRGAVISSNILRSGPQPRGGSRRPASAWIS
jgi:hypothetical protein